MGTRGSIIKARGLRHRMTEAERKPWGALRARRLGDHKFVRQEPIGAYVADFCCREARLVVEVDGSRHAESRRDELRDSFLIARGYRVLRFWNHEVMGSFGAVLDMILAHIEGPPVEYRPPHPLRSGTLSPLRGRGESGADSPSPPVGGERVVLAQRETGEGGICPYRAAGSPP